MSGEKHYQIPTNAENQADNFEVYYRPGHLSPSSWDSNEEELSDTDSSASDSTQRLTEIDTERKPLTDLCKNVISPGEQGRRHSLARMRRRSKCNSSTLDVRDFNYVYGKETSGVCNRPEVFCMKSRNMTSSDNDPAGRARDVSVSQNWDHLGPDQIMLDIQNYLNKQRFSQFSQYVVGSQSILNDPNESYISVSEQKYENSSDIIKSMDELPNFERKLNFKLSNILELEESRSNISPRSCRTSSSDKSRADDATIRPDRENESLKEETIVPFKLSSHEQVLDITDEDGSDEGSSMWTRIRVNIERKNAQHAMKYEDSEYVMNNLNYIFHNHPTGKEAKKQEDGIMGDKQAEQPLQDNLEVVSKAKRLSAQSEINQDGKYAEDDSKTPIEASSGRTLSHMSSKESAELGLDHLFSFKNCLPTQSSSVERPNNREGSLSNGHNFIVINDSNIFTRSDREAFLMHRQSSYSCSDSETSLSEFHNGTNSSNSANTTDYIKYIGQLFKRNQHKPYDKPSGIETESTRDSPSGKPEFTRNENLREREEKSEAFYSSFKCKLSNDSKNWNDNEVDNEANGRSNANEQSTPTFKRKIFLDLDLSDKEDRCLTAEKKVFSESPISVGNSPRGSFPISKFLRGTLHTPPSTSLIPVGDEITDAGKSALTSFPKMDTVCLKNQYPKATCNEYQVGDHGDCEWNTGETILDFPQDSQENNRISEWGKLLIPAEEGIRSKTIPEKHVFWIDVEENPKHPRIIKRGGKSEQEGNRYLDGPSEISKKPFLAFGERSKCTGNGNQRTGFLPRTLRVYSECSESKKIKYTRLQVRKRKRETAFTRNAVDDKIKYETSNARVVRFDAQPQKESKLFDQRGNWLISTFSKKEDIATRGKRLARRFLAKSKQPRRVTDMDINEKWHSGSGVSTSYADTYSCCFRHLFRQLFNLFTVSSSKC